MAEIWAINSCARIWPCPTERAQKREPIGSRASIALTRRKPQQSHTPRGCFSSDAMLLQHRQIAFAAIVTFLAAVPGSAREIVNYNAAVGPGTIVVRTR